MSRFSQKNQLEVVKKIISCELLLEEAMSTYGVKSKRSLKRWIKKHEADARRLLQEEKVPPSPQNDFSVELQTHAFTKADTIRRLYVVIELHKKLCRLHEKIKVFPKEMSSLSLELDYLNTKIQMLKSQIDFDRSVWASEK